MDSNDLSEDKDSGPEIQINFPSSVMSRIEELMGGTEQFDSDEFDAVAYINRIFPTEQSLSGVESAAARCEFRLAGVEQDIRKLVRAQADQRQAGQTALLDAQQCIAELALQVAEINKKAERSEGMVREITSEIKQLDCAKANLTAAITALNHLHMLVGGVHSLKAMTAARQYKELALPLQAIMEVLQHFENYQEIKELSTLRDQVYTIRDDLAQQILADFKQAFTGGGKSSISHRTLSEACGVVDVLDPKVKQDLLKWFIQLQLQEYEHLFSAEQEGAWLAHVERRYAWLKRRLLAFEDSLGPLFPWGWRLSERIAHHFAKITHSELSNIMAARRSEVDVKLLLYAIQKTYNFELLLHKRFTGTDLEGGNLELNPGDKTIDFDAEIKDEAPGASSPWVGLIGSCFEPYLSLYIRSLDANLRSLLDRFVQDAKSAPLPSGLESGGAVVASCADLFLFYKKCLVQCARLTTGEPMLELAGVFQKYLREYAASVVGAMLPAGPAPSGGLMGALGTLGTSPSVPTLVTNLHTLLRDDANGGTSGDTRYTKEEVSRITSVITTSEYCLETTVHLEQKLKEKVAPGLAARIDLAPEQDMFHKLIDDCIQLLVQDLEGACEPALSAMVKINWAGVESVGDQSPYVSQIVSQLRTAVPRLRDNLASSRKYFTQLCIRFAHSFIPKFVQSMYKCKPVSTVGAEQLLLDTHMLKTALLELPCFGSEVKRPAPAPYAKVVIRLMGQAEALLKVVMAPLEGSGEAFVRQLARLLPQAQPNDLHKLLAMKGLKLNRVQTQALDALFRQARDTTS